MSSSKKIACKGTLGQVFICLRPPPLLGFCLGWSSNSVGSESGQILSVKLLFGNIFFFIGHKIWSGSGRIHNKIGLPDPDPKVRITAPQIRIRKKYLHIWKKERKKVYFPNNSGTFLVLMVFRAIQQTNKWITKRVQWFRKGLKLRGTVGIGRKPPWISPRGPT